MLMHFIFIVIGLIVLLGAGEMLVRGAVSLANHLKVPALLIGLTIVAFGTSAPELLVSIQAVLRGDNGIAIGNIVGSNIANVFLVLGFPAVLAAISLKGRGLALHATVMLGATAVFAYLIYGPKELNPNNGAVLLVLIALYVAYIGFSAMKPGARPSASLLSEVSEITAETGSTVKIIGMLIVGLVGLPIGGWVLVKYGALLAAGLGVRDEIIGLTIVAFGTSLPELATVCAAAMKKQADVAVGNIIGSNIFNILFVGGAAGMAGVTEFSHEARTIDFPVMAIATLGLAAMIYARSTITRAIGIVLGVCYVCYIGWISIVAA